MTWFRKKGQLVRNFIDEFIDSMISHAYFFPYERKIRKKKKNHGNLAGPSGVYTRIYKTQPAEMGLTSLPISDEDEEVDEHFIQQDNTVYGTVSDRSRHQVTS